MGEVIRRSYDSMPEQSGQFAFDTPEVDSSDRASSIEKARLALKTVIGAQETIRPVTTAPDTTMSSLESARQEALDLSIGRTVIRGANLEYLRELTVQGKI